MKFLCDNCKAKYQIPDEKIAGRNLRMKCRKCGDEIIIRGPKTAEAVKTRGQQPRVAASGGRSALSADFRRGSALAAAAPAASASSVEWYVAINDVPVGPVKREEVARKIGMGAVTRASLCWREGLDDWRPVGEVAELASLFKARPAPPAPAPVRRAPPAPVARKAPPAPVAPRAPAKAVAKAEPAPKPSNVIPIGGRQGASPGDFDDEDEQTVLSSSPFGDDLEVAGQADAPAVVAKDVGREASGPQPTAAPLDPAAFDTPPASADDEESDRAAAVVPAAAASGSRLSPNFLIALVGVAVFCAVLAIFVGKKLLSDEPEPVAVADTPATIPSTDPVEATPELDVPEDSLPTEEPGGETETEPAGETENSGETSEENPGDERQPRAPSKRPRNTGSTSAMDDSSAMELSAEQRAMLERFGSGNTAEPNVAGINVGMGRSSTMAAQLDSAAVRRVVSATSNRNMLQRCYNGAIRGNPNPPNVRMDVRIRVGASGRVTSASATGDNVGQLRRCIETSVRRWRFPASSDGGEAAFPVVFSAPG